ncbi:ABC transporter substrate-binding protein [Halotalea alkalilenta]|uniref:Sugar ABC transporter substrate-binding protein n=1 Tax=Halotalea alkalilenta TaxID=376489 RepID=A0A172YIW0_9GAMM|nr:sugar ABC transporter substrate-binding protein [Halotalea alkalilenta]ANF59112.1 sugar ABC transporter substrate-binding protein [Halotalea alkalilenta]
MQRSWLLVGVGIMAAGGVAQAQTQITVASVNNPDMVAMQRLTGEFEQAHPDIRVNWVVLPENEIRQRITTDIASSAGQYDVVTVSNYETPIWAQNGWLVPFESLSEEYDEEDLLENLRQGLSFEDKLYALPFYGESSMTYYRKDLFEQAGLEMPERPTWSQMAEFAEQLTDRSNSLYGICLRGLPGWGENIAVFSTMVNAYGGRWFDESWQPQLDSPAWKAAAQTYVDLLENYGPPGVTSNGFTETTTLFAGGHCAMWVDATVAASFLSNPDTSQVADQVGFAQAPMEVTERGASWLYTWALAVPHSSRNQEAAQAFVEWATSKQYIELVGERNGWVSVPPGTRQSTYENQNYRDAASFSPFVLEAIQSADPTQPTQDPVPYTGIQFVAIPQFQSIGTRVGQIMAGILAKQTTVDQGLQQAQTFTLRQMTQGGYIE